MGTDFWLYTFSCTWDVDCWSMRLFSCGLGVSRAVLGLVCIIFHEPLKNPIVTCIYHLTCTTSGCGSCEWCHFVLDSVDSTVSSPLGFYSVCPSTRDSHLQNMLYLHSFHFHFMLLAEIQVLWYCKSIQEFLGRYTWRVGVGWFSTLSVI